MARHNLKYINDDYALNIINEFDNKETQNWDVFHDNKTVDYVNIPLNNDEAVNIIDWINSRISHGKCTITKILRIQNNYLMATYLLKKDMLEMEQGKERVKSRWLLHGTKIGNIVDIAENNFDLNMVQRAKHGNGINFTDDLEFARKFSNRGIKKVVVLSWVLEAMTCKGSYDLEVPPEGYDTTFNKDSNGRNIIVKYDDDTFYPAYAVYFNWK